MYVSYPNFYQGALGKQLYMSKYIKAILIMITYVVIKFLASFNIYERYDLLPCHTFQIFIILYLTNREVVMLLWSAFNASRMHKYVLIKYLFRVRFNIKCTRIINEYQMESCDNLLNSDFLQYQQSLDVTLEHLFFEMLRFSTQTPTK